MPDSLVPAAELARRGPVRFPNESAEYRAARTALLAEEIELRRHLESVAAQRRALPPGGEVIGDYRFQSEGGGLLGFEGNVADIEQRIALAGVARSPIERLIAWKQERGWKDLRLYSDVNGNY